jgi:nicotinate-nucleotide adenylyltransferase
MSHLPIGILGGTFNPIHKGHLAVAEAALALGLSKIHIIPARQPPHRPLPDTSAAHRVAMVRLALQDCPHFQLDLQEQQREGPSYMIDTLKSLRETYGPSTPLCLLLGIDALQNLDSWHQWRSLLDYAHIIGFSRPGYPFTLPQTLFPITSHQVPSITPCLYSPFGALYQYACETPPISASTLRAMLHQGDRSNTKAYLPKLVYEYIVQHHLYQH